MRSIGNSIAEFEIRSADKARRRSSQFSIATSAQHETPESLAVEKNVRLKMAPGVDQPPGGGRSPSVTFAHFAEVLGAGAFSSAIFAIGYSGGTASPRVRKWSEMHS